MLDDDEAVTLAMLLEELADRHPLDPLSAAALRAAALLRQRVATVGKEKGRGPWLGRADPGARQEAGDTRDDAADSRDTHARERDRLADERDMRAAERERLHDEADEAAQAGEQRIRDMLWSDERRAKATAAPQEPEDLEDLGVAEVGRAGDWEDHEAVRYLLSQARTARFEALRRRYAAGQDRVASSRDRHTAQADREDAARDRRAARADRDQVVIEGEEADPGFRD